MILEAGEDDEFLAGPWWHKYRGDPLRSDFRNFSYVVWKHIGLPDPTPAQYEIAYFLQHGWAGYGVRPDGRVVHWFGDEEVEPDRTGWTRCVQPSDLGRSEILEAFRGIGKSYLTAAFALWRLWLDPVDTKILVVSASSQKAKEFVSQTKAILNTLELLAHLRPRRDQRDQTDRFDVNGASISQSPSVKAAGITGQITGSRATLIIADDIEVTDNSRTEDARLRLLQKVNEFDAIKVTGYAEVIFLGTPQTEESIYTRLVKERGYLCFCLPARFPRADKRKGYVITRDDGSDWDILAPLARAADFDPGMEWKPTDPERFNEAQLADRESKGRSFFALQYMLDTSLSDAERYPLKQHDLIVMSINAFKAPMAVQWGHDTNGKNKRIDLLNYGFAGDHWVGPMFVDQEWREYEQAVLFVDPSGRGADETAWAVVKTLNGMLYVTEVGGYAGDPGESMTRIALAAKRHNVHEILVEPNYAGAVWIAAFQPVLAKVWPPARPGDTSGCTVLEAEWSRAQKEVRIIDTLEPVMTLHRLVLDESVAKDETLMYQLTHISRERGCLQHDDRIDALAGAVARFTSTLMLDADKAAKQAKDDELQEQLDEWIDYCEHFEKYGMRTGYSRDGEKSYSFTLN